LIPVGAGNTTILNVGVVTANYIYGTVQGAIEGTLDDWIVHAGDTNTKFGFLSDDVFEVHTAGTERIRIEADGHTQIGGVGLSGGNDHGLTVTEPGGTANVLELATTNANGRINFSRNLSSTLNTTSYIQWGEPGAQGTGDLKFGTSPASNSPVDRLHILSGGGVGIGASLYHLGDTNTFLNFGNDTISLKTGGSTRIYLDNNYPTWIRRDAAGIHTTAMLMNYATNASGNGVALAFAPTQNYTSRFASIEVVNQDGNNNMYMAFKTVDSSQGAHGIERLRILSTGQIKFATSNSTTDNLLWGSNPRLWLKCPNGINGLRIDSNTTPFEIRTTDANGRSIGVGGAPNFDLSISGDYSLSANGYDSSPKIFLNATRHNGSSTVTSFQTAIQAVATSNTNNTGYLGLGASASPDDLVIKTDAKIGMQITDPKSNLHVYGPGDIRLGAMYGGHASIMQQVEYSSGYTGVHWMFESNQSISWCFDGVMIVHGAGGSSYGSEVTHIKIVYSRENGALNSGDTWRNGSSDYNIETLGHGQVGLNPSAGSFSYTEQTNPDGTGSTRSLFKLSWSASGQGVGVWSKLIGNFYWAAASSSGSVEIQDKDGNIKFNSNP